VQQDAPPHADAPAVADGAPDGMPDGVPDAGPDAEVPGTATVHVTRNLSRGVPVMGAGVAVSDPSMPTAVVYATDATGSVVVEVRHHSTIWVRETGGAFGAYDDMFLIQDVSPGDVINVGPKAFAAAPGGGLKTINYSLLPGSYVYRHRYSDWEGCASGVIDDSSPGQVIIHWANTCEVSTREFVIAAIDTTTFEDVAYLRVPGVSNSGVSTIDATGVAWESPTTYTGTFTGFTGVANGSYAYASFVSDGSWRRAIAAATLNGGAGTDTFQDAGVPPHGTIMYEIEPQNARWQLGDDPAPTLPADLGMDSATALPFIAGISYDPSSHTINWNTVIDGALAPQVVTAEIWSEMYRLRIYAPGTATSLVIPEVPNELTTDEPDWTYISPTVYLIYAEAGSFTDLLTDADDHWGHLNSVPYRPHQRTRWSGGD
jgi:hypothetical protein